MTELGFKPMLSESSAHAMPASLRNGALVYVDVMSGLLESKAGLLTSFHRPHFSSVGVPGPGTSVVVPSQRL